MLRKPLVLDRTTGTIGELPSADSLDADTVDPLVAQVARMSQALKFLGVDPAEMPMDADLLDALGA